MTDPLDLDAIAARHAYIDAQEGNFRIDGTTQVIVKMALLIDAVPALIGEVRQLRTIVDEKIRELRDRLEVRLANAEMERNQAHAENERLRTTIAEQAREIAEQDVEATKLATTGEWRTRYYVGTENDSCWSTVRAERHTHQRQTWHGPIVPVDGVLPQVADQDGDQE